MIELVSYEKNREFEELILNLIVIVMFVRERFGILNFWEFKDYGRKFESFFVKNRWEYGELFDVFIFFGKVFNVNLCYCLGVRLLGLMVCLEGWFLKLLIIDLIGIY